MGDNPLLMTDIFTYISPLCLIALFFFCFCRFLARPCIASSSSRSSRSTNEFSATQGAAAITPSHRNERRRERNQRRRRSRTIPATVRVQPTGQLPPIHLISADFPEIMIVRPGDEPPKYEDAIKLKDATPPAYTPTITQTTTHTSSATTATAPSISTGHEDRERGTVSDCVHSVQSTESRTRDDPESSHAPIRRTHSLPHT
ncbi:unnamed protein product [Anisakis simplex]|uniref:Protein UL135 n=1 Tax=Anisakis simplex TaxID=6269 RepID=A0A0M3K0V3_ANISI|nr:unnamed protein product [Anisakis simplex]